VSLLSFLRSEPEYRVHLCFGPNCTPRGSRDLYPVLMSALLEAGITDRVEVITSTCRNRCEFGPSVNVYPGPVFYAFVDETGIRDIVQQHLIGGKPVERLRFKEPTGAIQPKRLSSRDARWRS
jgi:(2Fe-2S) ferredoxin